MNSFYQDYLKTGSEESKEVVLDAAAVLMKRYKSEGYIQAWDEWEKSGFGKNNQYRMIIDTMCNLPLMFTAYDLTGDETYYNAAVSHADMAQKYLVRNDYTTAHTFLFNPDGTPNRRETHQGYADDSCWARGQAWAVNGFAQAYLMTGNKEYLNTAVRCCDVFLQKTDTDLVPRWDMVFQNNSNEPKDSSAAGILSCGMMDLWEATGNRWYKDAANQMFEVLYENYSSKDEAEEEGLILHATGNKPGNVAIDCSLIYGDMYFAQLIDRLSE